MESYKLYIFCVFIFLMISFRFIHFLLNLLTFCLLLNDFHQKKSIFIHQILILLNPYFSSRENSCEYFIHHSIQYSVICKYFGSHSINTFFFHLSLQFSYLICSDNIFQKKFIFWCFFLVGINSI